MIIALSVEAAGADRFALAYSASVQLDGVEVMTFGAKRAMTDDLILCCAPEVAGSVAPVIDGLDLPIVGNLDELYRHWYLSAYQPLMNGASLAMDPTPAGWSFLIGAHGDRDSGNALHGLHPTAGVPRAIDISSMALGKGYAREVADDIDELAKNLEIFIPGVRHDPLRDARTVAACYWRMSR